MNFKKKIFLLLWVIFALLDLEPDPDPDPLTRLNPDPIRIQIRNPVDIDHYKATTSASTQSITEHVENPEKIH
jgi:hypothetical protein